MSGVAKNLEGQVFGRLIVIHRLENVRNHPMWLCRCVCGKEKGIRPDGLKNGMVQSCGCLRNEIATERIGKPGKGNPRFKHGHRLKIKRSPTYYSWDCMKSRCYNPKSPNFEYYGGRGIEVCSQWLGKDGFEVFLKDLGERPSGHTIDRIDSDKGYFPDNVRWATPVEQTWNRRGNYGRK